MSKLVFLEPNCLKAVPYTTSKVISEFTGVGHRHIKKQISLHRQQLETFGLLVAYETESTGGRPEEITQLNEQQATLLVTFLKNTPVVVEFKTELVRQFYQMRTELQMRHLWREGIKPIRREMTDVIQENPDHSKWDFKLYTDLAYKIVTSKTAAQIRKERGAPKKAKAIEYMTSDEMERIARLTNKISVLLELGNDYYAIKDILTKKYLKSA
ncbi:Rha family transcriptional regulator [Desulfosporosinus youngiae]|uniref:Putative phage-encoded protein n=1 Tax=Desulfosporosinus youngiae DSM 17734 TaxID=768710 RepID=H5Y231_9FIRM|nr:Rha family transcriptional regulator [Desulfosporosinus youngiae]EHQ88229.1 putative phage-encoded protein [Desulfosporosinus youngiae DSM 17734]